MPEGILAAEEVVLVVVVREVMVRLRVVVADVIIPPQPPAITEDTVVWAQTADLVEVEVQIIPGEVAAMAVEAVAGVVVWSLPMVVVEVDEYALRRCPRAGRRATLPYGFLMRVAAKRVAINAPVPAGLKSRLWKS